MDEWLGEREKAVARWFTMWLERRDLGILELFAPDAVYVESWGPRYQGAEKIKHWFEEWNTRGRVQIWDIRQYFHKGDQTVVEWFFKCEMRDGTTQSFDGISQIRWTEEGRIAFLKEFGCNINCYDPYQNGPEPVFRQEQTMWF